MWCVNSLTKDYKFVRCLQQFPTEVEAYVYFELVLNLGLELGRERLPEEAKLTIEFVPDN